jgi:Metal-dependent hydrolase
MTKKFLFLLLMIMPNMKTNASCPDEQLANRDLKILSWNIYMLPYISIWNNNQERARLIVQELEHSDYQIIVFQEAFSSRCRNIIAKGLAEKFPYQYGPENPNYIPLFTNSGLWVVSKIPLKKLGVIKFSKSQGYDMIARKGAVLFEGIYQNSPFQLLATHLQADEPHLIRDQQCREISEHLLVPFEHEHIPQLICGDFNIDMDDSQHYRRMLETLDAQNGEISGSIQTTYDEIDNPLARVPSGKKRVIDYILVRNSKLIRRIERKIQFIYTHKKNGDVDYLSDHNAMEMSINLGKLSDGEIAQHFSLK